jgi:chromosome segregation ATPase
MKKLGEATEGAEAEVEAAIARVLDESGDGDDGDEAFDQVVGSLQLRLDEALTENERLDRELEATRKRVVVVEGALRERAASTRVEEEDRTESAQQELAEAQQRVELAEAESEETREGVEQLRTDLQAAQEEVEELRQQLAVAQDLLTQGDDAEDTDDDIDEAVSSALAKHDVLTEYRAVLETARDADGVDALVETLIPLVTTPLSESESNRKAPRSTLPRGPVESESTAGSRRLATNPSQGAALAGKAVKQMRGGR